MDIAIEREQIGHMVQTPYLLFCYNICKGKTHHTFLFAILYIIL